MLRRTSSPFFHLWCWTNLCLAAVAITPLHADVRLVLVGGKVVTQTGQGTIDADVLIQDGKIVAVGRPLELDMNTRRVDVSDMIITPGWIDSRSTLWLNDTARFDAAANGSLRVLDGVDPFQKDWQEVAAHGITSVYIQPSTTGILGGQGAVLRVAGARSVEDLVLRDAVAAQASLGVGPRSESARDRFAQYDQLKKAFEAAQKYADEWKKYDEAMKKKKEEEQKPKEGEAKPAADATKPAPPADAHAAPPSGQRMTREEMLRRMQERGLVPPGAAPPAGTPPAVTTAATPATVDATKKPEEIKKPVKDEAKEFLVRVLRAEIPLRLEAHRGDDISHALKLATEFKIRLILDGASEPRSATYDLQRSHTPLVLGPVLEFTAPPAYRATRADDWLVQRLTEDPRFALATFAQTGRESRLLRAHAAAAVAQGVAPEKVLAAVTSNAAALLGIDDLVGSIAVGKQADVAVFAGDPLDPATPVRMVISKGEIVHELVTKATGDDGAVATIEILPAKLPNSYVLVADRVLYPNGKFKSAAIVVKDGRITAIRNSQRLPKGVTVFSLGNAVITPGLISPLAFFTEGGGNDSADANAAQLRAVDALNVSSEAAQTMLRGGFLTLGVAPEKLNVFAGAIGCVRLGTDGPVREPVIAGQIVLTGAARLRERLPSSLPGQLQLIDDVFSGTEEPSRLFLPDTVLQQLILDRRRAVEGMKSREHVAVFDVSAAEEIQGALQLIEKYKLRGVLSGAQDMTPYLDDIKRLGVGVIARPMTTFDYDRYVAGLVAASAKRIPLAFAPGTPDRIRLTVAMAVHHGMSPDAALSALTNQAAKLVGMPPGTGELAVDRSADMVIWDGSPLNLASQVKHRIVDGQIVEATRE